MWSTAIMKWYCCLIIDSIRLVFKQIIDRLLFRSLSIFTVSAVQDQFVNLLQWVISFLHSLPHFEDLSNDLSDFGIALPREDVPLFDRILNVRVLHQILERHAVHIELAAEDVVGPLTRRLLRLFDAGDWE